MFSVYCAQGTRYALSSSASYLPSDLLYVRVCVYLCKQISQGVSVCVCECVAKAQVVRRRYKMALSIAVNAWQILRNRKKEKCKKKILCVLK